MLDHTPANLFDVFAPRMSLALRFFQQCVSDRMCGKAKLLLWGRICSKAILCSHSLEMSFSSQIWQRATFLESHLHLLLVISMSLLEILCLSKPQTAICYAEPWVQCCVNVMQLILTEGAARYRDSIELLQNWLKTFLIAANLNFPWHTVACVTQR